MKQYIAVVKVFYIVFRISAPHFPDELRKLSLLLICQLFRRPPYCNGFQRDAHFLDLLVVLRAELSDVGPALRLLSKETLMLQLKHCFAQCRLPDPQTRRPLLL
jgi:hypothetical protein